MPKKILITLALILCSTDFSIAAIEAHTYKKDHVYYVEGVVDAGNWYEQGLNAITDYANYHLWITKGIDGKDPVSAEFWEHFIDFQYEAPSQMTVIYDLNLGWPLGSRGNKARFRIDESEMYKGILRLKMLDKPAGLEDATLSLYTEPSETVSGDKSFRFEMALKFSWLLEALIDPDKLAKHMNIVIGTAVSNLESYCTVKAN